VKIEITPSDSICCDISLFVEVQRLFVFADASGSLADVTQKFAMIFNFKQPDIVNGVFEVEKDRFSGPK
jgi:hypothetical protein